MTIWSGIIANVWQVFNLAVRVKRTQPTTTGNSGYLWRRYV